MIVVAVVFIVVTKLLGWLVSHSLLVGETVAVFAFGLSWLMKGLELDILRTPGDGRRQPSVEVAVGAR
jgi:hypothetical protein